MRWIARNSLVIALVLVLVTAASSMGVARQSGGTPAAGTPVEASLITGTPVEASPVAGTPIDSSADALTALIQPSDLLERLPQPIPGEVTVIADSSITTNSDDETRTMVLVRNGTNQPVGNVAVTGSVRDASGALVAAGASESTWPAVIQPGGVAQAFVIFQGDVPDFTFGSYSATWGALPDNSLLVDLVIQEANPVAESIIGFVRNDTNETAYFGVVAGSCFNSSGVLDDWTVHPLDNTRLEPGQSAPFEVSFGAYACQSFILTTAA